MLVYQALSERRWVGSINILNRSQKNVVQVVSLHDLHFLSVFMQIMGESIKETKSTWKQP